MRLGFNLCILIFILLKCQCEVPPSINTSMGQKIDCQELRSTYSIVQYGTVAPWFLYRRGGTVW